jgi:hypothetical protein
LLLLGFKKLQIEDVVHMQKNALYEFKVYSIMLKAT